MVRSRLTAVLALGLATILVVATETCETGSTGLSSDGVVDHVLVQPSNATLAPGATRQLSATAYDVNGGEVSGAAVHWSSSSAAVATANASGLVTAVGAGSANITATVGGRSGQASVTVVPAIPSGSVIDVYPSVTYQTMRGWEATAQIGQTECDPQKVAAYRNAVLDRVANELGINRIRLEARSGLENPVDYYTERWVTHTIDNATYASHFYEIINDNSDPHVLNPAGFQFAAIDNTVDAVVNPLRQRLQARERNSTCCSTTWISSPRHLNTRPIRRNTRNSSSRCSII